MRILRENSAHGNEKAKETHISRESDARMSEK